MQKGMLIKDYCSDPKSYPEAGDQQMQQQCALKKGYVLLIGVAEGHFRVAFAYFFSEVQADMFILQLLHWFIL